MPISVLSVVSFDESAHRTVYNIRIMLYYVIPRELTPTQPLRGESGEKSTFCEKIAIIVNIAYNISLAII